MYTPTVRLPSPKRSPTHRKVVRHMLSSSTPSTVLKGALSPMSPPSPPSHPTAPTHQPPPHPHLPPPPHAPSGAAGVAVPLCVSGSHRCRVQRCPRRVCGGHRCCRGELISAVRVGHSSLAFHTAQAVVVAGVSHPPTMLLSSLARSAQQRWRHRG